MPPDAAIMRGVDRNLGDDQGIDSNNWNPISTEAMAGYSVRPRVPGPSGGKHINELGGGRRQQRRAASDDPQST